VRAVVVTFHSAVSLDAVHDDFMAGAGAIAEVPGLLSKTWIAEDERLGRFSDANAAKDCLDGPIISETRAVPVFSDREVRHFTVPEAFDAITRGIPAAAPSPADWPR
jgi:hypothetical protein